MTAPPGLLARLREHGAEVRFRDGRPVLHAPVALPPDLLSEARQHRAALLRLLAPAEPTAIETRAADPDLALTNDAPTAPCRRCRGCVWWRRSIVSGGPGPWQCVACAPPPADAWVDGSALPDPEARLRRDDLPPALAPPSAEAVAARAAELLGAAQRTSGVRITDHDLALAYFRSRAIAELDKERRRR